MDLLFTKDLQLVTFHDVTMDRTTNCTGKQNKSKLNTTKHNKTKQVEEEVLENILDD